MISNYVLGKIFKGVQSIKINSYKRTEASGVEYKIYERFSGSCTSLTASCCVKILWNYGNASNIELLDPLMDAILAMFETALQLYKLHLVLVIWEYPTYGNARLGPHYCEPGLFLSLGKEVFEMMKALPSVIDQLYFVVGHSLGTAVASYLSTLDNGPDGVLLLNPFARILEGTGSWASVITSEPFDNVVMLQNRKCLVMAMFSEKDKILPVKFNLKPLGPVLDHWYEEPGASHESVLVNFDHMFHAVRSFADWCIIPKLKIVIEVCNLALIAKFETESSSSEDLDLD